jgi:predicted DNA-binding transcriptional regulator AlpA
MSSRKKPDVPETPRPTIIQPYDPLIRKKEILRILDISAPTLWRMIRDELFPRPVTRSKRLIGWPESVVYEHMRKIREKAGY